MANQVSVNGSGVVQINVATTPNIQVNTGRTVIANITNVPSANTANFALFANVANTANYAGNVTGNAQPNITSVGTLTTLSVTGNVTANYFVGNGYTLTAINGANIIGNISGNISNAEYAQFAGVAATANSVAGANVSGTVANAQFANFAGTANTANSVQGSNVIGSVAQANFANTANAVAGANVSGTVANAQFANFAGTANTANAVNAANVIGTVANANYAAFAGDVVNSNQPNITSLGTLNALSVTGNVSANYFIGNGYTLTAINGANVIGNISGNISNADYALFAGTANTANSVQGSNVIGSVAQANIANTANAVAGANVSGIVANANYAAFSGNVVNSAQPNITSLGSLTGLNVSGDALVTGNLIVDGNLVYVNVENFNVEDPIVELGGGANGAPLTTNDGKDRGAILHYYNGTPIDAFMGYDNSNAELLLATNVTVTNDVVSVNDFGNVRVGNIIGNLYGVANSAITAATVTQNAQPNITSVGNLGNLTVTGNVSANYFIGNGYTITAINGANIIGNISGNISNADYALFAGTANTANTVAGANVTGTVANANYAAYAGNAFSVAGSNVVGAVAFATTANSVSGANVSGAVANAVYADFSGVAGSANAVAGANVSGIVANANYAAFSGNVTVNAQPNITSVGTLANLSVTGNVSANFYTGNGSLLTGIVTGTPNAIVNGNSNVTVDANSNVRVSVAGTANTVTFTSSNTIFNSGSGGNITGANLVQANFFSGNGSLLTGIVATSGNANYANFAGNAFSVAGANVVGPVAFATTANSVSGANVSGAVANAVYADFSGIAGSANAVAGANVSGIVANANYAAYSANVTGNAQPNITSVGTLTDLTVTGNVSANYYIGNGSLLTGIATGTPNAIVNGTSNVTVDANSNVRVSVSGNANVATFTDTGLVLGTGTGGNITNANVISANLFSGNGALLSALNGANVTGIVANANYAAFSGNVTVNAQPNITSLGTLSSLDVNGTANLGQVANVKILGGSNLQVLSTDGTGNLNWVTQTGGSGNPGGNTTELQFNDSGTFGGTPNVTFALGNLSLGNIANVKILGGSSNQVIQTDGSGNLTFVTPSSGGGGDQLSPLLLMGG